MRLKTQTILLNLAKKLEPQPTKALKSINVGGVRLWTPSVPLGQMNKRYQAMQVNLTYLDKKVNIEDVRARIETAIAFHNKGDKASLGHALKSMQDYLDLEITGRNLFKVANQIILLDAEPYDECTDYWEQRKWDLFSTNDEIRTFFLITANNIYLPLINMQGTMTDQMEFLNNQVVRATENNFTKLLQKNTTPKLVK